MDKNKKKKGFIFYLPMDILKHLNKEAKINGMSRNGFLCFLVLNYFAGKLNHEIQNEAKKKKT
jgi:hypothetical protein